MRCELCNSGDRIPGWKLCPACKEAIDRLWIISNHGGFGSVSSSDSVGAAARSGSAPVRLKPAGADL